ncbi:LysR family transcriptional regulator (plasmid) [Bosea sp. F3-2]|uniref:LysR family transcriptional regulator n=1 Tax=Bosea sp. F3-2 TaxID=2599640 RepID=UPI0011F05B30|nr:LysR family transcriptional regulator [Bosea sp. F3-2]QEL27337.1 LysR family transcriptional regulator [Bosea sp. F3-2]
MDIRHLRCFYYVADLGSVTRASSFLHVTQPAISRTIRALEDELGVPLFERNGRGVTLTEAGTQLFGRCQQIFQMVEDTRREVISFAGSVSGDVVLGVPPSLFAFTPGLLTRCRELHPHIHIRLLDGFNGYLQDWLLAGAVDLAVLNGRASDLRKYKATHLATDRLYVIGRHDDRSSRAPAVAREIAFHTLGDLPVILPTRMSALRKLIEEAAIDAGIQIRPLHELDSVAAIKELILRGEGVAILPLASIARELESGQLWAARLTRPEVQRELVVATSIDRPASKAVRAVQEVIVKDFRTIAEALDYSLGFL